MIFISYSRKDISWVNRLVRQLSVYERSLDIRIWYDRNILPGEEWSPEIDQALEKASVAILLVSENFLASDFITNIELPQIEKRWQSGSLSVVPILIDECQFNKNNFVEKLQFFNDDMTRPLCSLDDSDANLQLVYLAKFVSHFFTKSDDPAKSPNTYLKPKRISVSHLPYSRNRIFGREKETKVIRSAWADPDVHVMVIFGPGGIGKSTLLANWLEKVAQEKYLGADYVFCFSFQGRTSENVKGAEEFFNLIFAWFDLDPTTIPMDGLFRAIKLKSLLINHNVLLVLDSLEALQDSSGKVKDDGLSYLLKELVADNNGLLLLTSRYMIPELVSWESKHSLVKFPLSPLPDNISLSILTDLGVTGPEEAMRDLIFMLKGHALSLVLTGNYICRFLGGNILKMPNVQGFTFKGDGGDHAIRIINEYEKSLDAPGRAVLYILSLFDEPVVPAEIDALLSTKTFVKRLKRILGKNRSDSFIIPQSTDASAWNEIVYDLRACQLLNESDDENSLDTHIIIKSYFAKRFQEKSKKCWQLGHRILYEHYKDSVTYLPKTINEILLLYRAVRHGCYAFLHEKARKEVLWPRIHQTKQKKGKSIALHKFGTIEVDLRMETLFFEKLWDKPLPFLSHHTKNELFSNVGFELTKLGRFKEAIDPMARHIDHALQTKDLWFQMTASTYTPFDIHFGLGNLRECEDIGNRWLKAMYDKAILRDHQPAEILWERMSARSNLANVYHCEGRLIDAMALFHVAEYDLMRLKSYYTNIPEFFGEILFGECGAYYCELLLHIDHIEEVFSRLEKMEKRRTHHDSITNRTSEELIFARAEAINKVSKEKVLQRFNSVINTLTFSGHKNILPSALVSRAIFKRDVLEDYREAEQDIQLALSMSLRMEARLMEVDARIEYAKLYELKGNQENQAEHIGKVKKIIDATGYMPRFLGPIYIDIFTPPESTLLTKRNIRDDIRDIITKRLKIEKCEENLRIFNYIFPERHLNIAMLYIHMASIYYKHRQFKEAIEFCDKAITIFDQNEVIFPEFRQPALELKANALFNLKKYDESLSIFKLVAELLKDINADWDRIVEVIECIRRIYDVPELKHKSEIINNFLNDMLLRLQDKAVLTIS